MDEWTTPKPEELLKGVHDKDSFIKFVQHLARQRELAENAERRDPENFCLDGEFGWKNADISSYLSACLDYFTDKPFHKPESNPSWRMFAEFLYFGKIIE